MGKLGTERSIDPVGRIVIPAQMREKYCLGYGDRVMVSDNGRGFMVTPVEAGSIGADKAEALGAALTTREASVGVCSKRKLLGGGGVFADKKGFSLLAQTAGAVAEGRRAFFDDLAIGRGFSVPCTVFPIIKDGKPIGALLVSAEKAVSDKGSAFYEAAAKVVALLA